jgi:hypothetical protein
MRTRLCGDVVGANHFLLTHASFAEPEKKNQGGDEENNKANYHQDYDCHDSHTDRIGSYVD